MTRIGKRALARHSVTQKTALQELLGAIMTRMTRMTRFCTSSLMPPRARGKRCGCWPGWRARATDRHLEHTQARIISKSIRQNTKTMNQEKDNPTQLDTASREQKVTELYWIKTENGVLRLGSGSGWHVYEDATIIWEAKRDEAPFSYEDAPAEDAKDLARASHSHYVSCLFTLEEALSVASALENEIEGRYLLGRVSLPIEKERAFSASISFADCLSVEVEGLSVWGYYNLHDATYVGEERDGTLYRSLELDLPVEMIDKLEKMEDPGSYLADLEDVAKKVRQLSSNNKKPASEAKLPF